jgi:hypothetical protein
MKTGVQMLSGFFICKKGFTFLKGETFKTHDNFGKNLLKNMDKKPLCASL